MNNIFFQLSTSGVWCQLQVCMQPYCERLKGTFPCYSNPATHTLTQTCASDLWPQSWSLLFSSFAPSVSLWITTRHRMKIAAAIKFSGQYCLCAFIHPARTELLLLLMLPWSCTGGTLSVARGFWQVSPTALYWPHVKPMSRHLLPPSVSPLCCSHHCLHRTSLAFSLFFVCFHSAGFY